MEAASNAGEASGASGAGHGFSLVWPLGSKFAAAMLMHPCGPVYVTGGGGIPRWRQPPAKGQGVCPVSTIQERLCTWLAYVPG